MIGKAVNKSPRKLRLRTTLVVPFVLQILAAVGLVGYLSFLNSERAVDDLAKQLQHEVSSRVHERVQDHLETPHLVNQINEDAARLGALDFNDLESSRRYLWKQVLRFKSIGYAGLANDKGQYLRIGWVNRLASAERPQLATQLEPGTGDLNFNNLDPEGNPIGVVKTTPNYDVRQRPFYKAVLKNRQAAWTDIYLNFGYDSLQINASSPYYDPQGNLIGIFTCQMGLDQISSFLQTLRVGKSGQVFLIEPSGELIATSLTNQTLTTGTGEAKKQLRAQESRNLVMRRSMEYLQTSRKDLQTLQAPTRLDFQLEGQRQFLEVSPLRDQYGLNWLIVVVIPEADFMEQINANTRNTGWLCLGALGLAIALGVRTSRWVTRPILRISQAANTLAQGHLDQQVAPSLITEIDTLADSFNGMASQLKESFDALRIAEENYRSIFENAVEGIFQSSPDGQFINANPALAKIYGYDSPSELIEQITDIGEQLYVDPEKRTEFRELLEQQNTVKNFEYRCYCKDGSIIWTQIDARVVRDSRNQLLYCEGIVQDITDRKRREDELRRQLEELKIEIDQKKREKEVAMLTESTYFQEIQQEIAKVNLDEFWS
jgi:PAS domain S-box-containing protein